MAKTKEQASAEIEAALPALVEFDMPSTRHMDRDEREAAIGQMLADLFLLAKNDGCIAAAWAYEFCTNLKPLQFSSVLPTAPGWYWCRDPESPNRDPWACSVYRTPYGMAAASYEWVTALNQQCKYEFAGPIQKVTQ